MLLDRGLQMILLHRCLLFLACSDPAVVSRGQWQTLAQGSNTKFTNACSCTSSTSKAPAANPCPGTSQTEHGACDHSKTETTMGTEVLYRMRQQLRRVGDPLWHLPCVADISRVALAQADQNWDFPACLHVNGGSGASLFSGIALILIISVAIQFCNLSDFMRAGQTHCNRLTAPTGHCSGRI